MVFGANTYRLFAQMVAESTEDSEVYDPWVNRMRHLPASVVSTTLDGPLDWPDATVGSGDAVDVVAPLKEESEVPCVPEPHPRNTFVEQSNLSRPVLNL